MLPLESVPNVSEGRDRATIDALTAAYDAAGARVLDVHTDPDHHRSVHTLVAPSDEALVDALLGGIAAARELIDLRAHDGVHPRIGAADVVPLVPLVPDDLPRAQDAARALAQRVGDELGLPAFLYGESAGGKRPAFFRRGGPIELQRRIDAGELAPDAGPPRLHPSVGGVLIGARAPLAAFNLVLDTPDIRIADQIARAVRGSSGGLPGVQAIGLHLASTGRAQVSMNVIDLDAAPLHVVVEHVRDEAGLRGTRVVEGELVGLLLARVVHAAARARGVDDVDASGLPGPAARGVAAAAFALPRLPVDRVVEHYLR
jgi:glutamate formiminotransferase